jgi:hypothetical protein
MADPSFKNETIPDLSDVAKYLLVEMLDFATFELSAERPQAVRCKEGGVTGHDSTVASL